VNGIEVPDRSSLAGVERVLVASGLLGGLAQEVPVAGVGWLPNEALACLAS
jgi:hypothetical protein